MRANGPLFQFSLGKLLLASVLFSLAVSLPGLMARGMVPATPGSLLAVGVLLGVDLAVAIWLLMVGTEHDLAAASIVLIPLTLAVGIVIVLGYLVAQT